jgi:hypothetical protein
MNKKIGSVVVGTESQIAMSEITRLTLLCPELVSNFPFAVIACLDSGREISLAIPSIQKLLEAEVSIRTIGQHLLTTGPAAVDIITRFGLFNGFDELWLFSREPQNDIPRGFRIRSSEILNVEYQMTETEAERWCSELARWMAPSGAVLGIADGVALDYVSTDEQIAVCIGSFYSA